MSEELRPYAKQVATLLVDNKYKSMSPYFFELLVEELNKLGFTLRLEQRGIHGTYVQMEGYDV